MGKGREKLRVKEEKRKREQEEGEKILLEEQGRGQL